MVIVRMGRRRCFLAVLRRGTFQCRYGFPYVRTDLWPCSYVLVGGAGVGVSDREGTGHARYLSAHAQCAGQCV